MARRREAADEALLRGFLALHGWEPERLPVFRRKGKQWERFGCRICGCACNCSQGPAVVLPTPGNPVVSFAEDHKVWQVDIRWSETPYRHSTFLVQDGARCGHLANALEDVARYQQARRFQCECGVFFAGPAADEAYQAHRAMRRDTAEHRRAVASYACRRYLEEAADV